MEQNNLDLNNQSAQLSNSEYGIISNNNDNVNYEYASFWYRVGASLLDFLIFLPLSLLLSGFNLFINNIFKDYPQVNGILVLFINLVSILIVIFYNVYFETSKYRGSIGKILLKIIVSDDKGYSISRRSSILRNTIKSTVSFITLFLSSIVTLFLFVEVNLDKNILFNILSTILILGGCLFVLIDCLTVNFSNKNQALHDMLAKALVLRKIN